MCDGGITGLFTVARHFLPVIELDTAPRDFFALAEQRLGWIDRRQQVLAQNIANADTPQYLPRDLAPFSAALGAVLARTDPRHLAGSGAAPGVVVPTPLGRAPDGNGVDIEDQLTRVADDETQQALVGNLWKSTMGLYLAALGRS